MFGETEGASHVLASKGIKPIATWDEWKACWDSHSDTPTLLGLLHYGFEVRALQDTLDCHTAKTYAEQEAREQIYRERIYFYLAVANGYMSASPCLSSIPREIRDKAWRVLCKNFFEPAIDNVYHHGREKKLAEEEAIVKELLWFFGNPTNIPHIGDHRGKIVHHFLFELAKKAWEIGWDGGFPYDPHIADCFFRKYRPQLMEILFHIGKLEWLVDVAEWIDKDDLSALYELSLKHIMKPHGLGSDPYKTFGEALLAKSPAATTYVLLERISEEYAKAKEIKRLTREKREAEEKLCTLGVKK